MRYNRQGHIFFDEAIIAFSKYLIEKGNHNFKTRDPDQYRSLCGYLVLDFRLTRDIIWKDFKICMSEKIGLDFKDRFGQQISWSYISAVMRPEDVSLLNPDLYTLALSSICSFSFERPVYSVSHSMIHTHQLTSSEKMKHICTEFPIQSLGNGNVPSVDSSVIEKWISNFKETMSIIEKLSNPNISSKKPSYTDFLQSIRLTQLSYQNRISDFDLSFSLLVAAIESQATSYSKAQSPQRDPKHDDWKKLKDNPDKTIAALAEKYIELWGKFSQAEINSQIKARFIKFIFDFAPKETWFSTLDDDILRDGLSYREKYPYEVSQFPELTPNNFTDKQLQKIIEETYSYRSKFFHSGKSTPHRTPKNSNYNRFFEKINKIEASDMNNDKPEYKSTYHYHAKYELISHIARISLTKYADESISKKIKK